ncbi:MAG: type VI secretion system baseplate subunit TssK [Pirellulaceae bacterium]
MRHLPVHWYEGMFLRPQHFQAADRHWTELVSASQHWDNHYNYGIREIQISREALANYQLHVSMCNARLRDGTLISFEKGQGPDRVALKGAFEKNTHVTVFLAVPKLNLGRRNVAQSDSGEKHRYSESTISVQDETLGGNDQEIQFRNLSVCLLLSTDDPSGYEVLPIARIKRVGTEEATPELDDNFIPPLIAADAWEPLSIDIVRTIYDIIGQKIEVLSNRAAERNINLSSHQPGDLDDLLMLSLLNQSYAFLNCTGFALGVHPFLIYSELCRIVGMLSIFDPTRRVTDIPRYDHDDLARIFKWIKLRIEQLLGGAKKLDYQQRYFVGTERGMQVSIEPDWLHSSWSWYVGVHSQNISEADCREILRPGKLDWKIGSSQQVDLIFKHGLPGVEQLELDSPPRALPPQNWIYYDVQRNNTAWKDVLASQTLALRFKTELIGNIATLKGQRQLEVTLPDKRVILEFALFAVPQGM